MFSSYSRRYIWVACFLCSRYKVMDYLCCFFCFFASYSTYVFKNQMRRKKSAAAWIYKTLKMNIRHRTIGSTTKKSGLGIRSLGLCLYLSYIKSKRAKERFARLKEQITLVALLVKSDEGICSLSLFLKEQRE